jgi:4-hydroxy-3-methylbut-2-enyl diphosphate reductase
MCFGVRDALQHLEAIERPEDVTIRGELVHNETVLIQLGARGFRMRGEMQRWEIPETSAVLITAHGISDKERQRLATAGKTLIDTTCPLVQRVHRAAQALYRQGYFMVVVGRRDHVEVRGIVEDLDECVVIEHEGEVRAYPVARIGVVCQTTTAPATVAAIRTAMVRYNPRARICFKDTTCAPTRENQKALADLLPTVDAVVVVGGRNSNNTRELVSRCEDAGKRVIHVQDSSGLKSDWFDGCKRVGLVAGTSTLDETLDQVQRRLEQIAMSKFAASTPDCEQTPETRTRVECSLVSGADS